MTNLPKWFIIKPQKEKRRKKMYDEEIYRYWNYLTETGIATDEEIGLVTAIKGTNLETMKAILYVRTGYNSIEQIEEE